MKTLASDKRYRTPCLHGKYVNGTVGFGRGPPRISILVISLGMVFFDLAFSLFGGACLSNELEDSESDHLAGHTRIAASYHQSA